MSSPKGLINSISSGIISSLRRDDGVSIIQFTAPVSSGSSGGVLITETGNLIGLISSQYSDGQNLNFALRIDEIVNDLSVKPENNSNHNSCLLKELENKKIKTNPYLNEIENLLSTNLALAYEKMKANYRLVVQSSKLLYFKMDYELNNQLYTDFIASSAVYFEKRGMNPLLSLSLMVFEGKLTEKEFSDSYYMEIINQINEKFLNIGDFKPFSNLLLGTCKFKIKDYYSAISYMNDFVTVKDFDFGSDKSFQATANNLLRAYLYYGYEIMGLSYISLGNLQPASVNLIKCLELSSDKDFECEISKKLIIILVKQGDTQTACKYFSKYKFPCQYDYDFKKALSDYCQ